MWRVRAFQTRRTDVRVVVCVYITLNSTRTRSCTEAAKEVAADDDVDDDDDDDEADR